MALPAGTTIDGTNGISGTGAFFTQAVPVGPGTAPGHAPQMQQVSATIILQFGGNPNGVADNYGAFVAAKAVSPVIKFPFINGSPNIYYFSQMSESDLSNVSIFADGGPITLSIPSNLPPYGATGLVIGANVNIIYRDIEITTVFEKTKSGNPLTISPLQTVKRQNVKTLDCTNYTLIPSLSVQWPTSDVFSASAPLSASPTGRQYSAAAIGYFFCDFIAIAPGESVFGQITSTSGANAFPAIIVRTTNGFYAFFQNPTSVGAGVNWAVKPIGSAEIAEGNFALPGQGAPMQGGGTFDLMDWGKSNFGVGRLSKNTFVLYVNGKSVSPNAVPGFNSGDIIDVGFGVYVSASTATWTSGNYIVRRDPVMLGIDALQSISIYGDSRSQKYPNCWADRLAEAMDGVFGVKLQSIANNAIAGETLEQQYAIMQTVGFGSARYAVISLVTNDIQELEALNTAMANFAALLNFCVTAQVIPVVIIPYFWYPAAARGGTGQPSSNYDNGAPYRAAMMQQVAALAPNAILVDAPLEYPFPNPAYVNTQPDPLLRDDIHQSPQLHVLEALAVAKAILGHLCAVPDIEHLVLPSAYGVNFAESGITSDTTYPLAVDITKDGMISLSGGLDVSTTPANGATLCTLPRYLWPVSGLVFGGLCTSSSTGALGTCQIGISQYGVVTGAYFPAGTQKIFLLASWAAAAAIVATH